MINRLTHQLETAPEKNHWFWVKLEVTDFNLLEHVVRGATKLR